MPEMDGVEATRRIMSESPRPVLVVCASAEGEVSKVFEAMGYGALDVVDTPTLGDGAEAKKSREDLLKKIKWIEFLCRRAPAGPEPEGRRRRRPGSVPRMLAIGASTGGPKALCQVLSEFPPDANTTVVIVQHLDQAFSGGMVQWLDSQVPAAVTLAGNGESPKAGKVYLASSNDHLVLTAKLAFAYTAEPRDNAYRPSVDVFFESLSSFWPDNGVALLLTGMGRDGAAGLATLRKKGWHTIAQDKSTRVVYGMPKAAAELDAAEEILPLWAIGKAIAKHWKAGS